MKILLWDIETAPNLAYVWGKYQQDVIAFEKEWELLCYAYKWLGGKNVTCVRRIDFPGQSEKQLVASLHSLLTKADIVIHHNGDKFDLKKANAKFLEHGLAPVVPPITVDTYKVAKNQFAFNGNRLDDIAKLLGVGRKVSHPGFEMWKGCLTGDKKSWALMSKYNKRDVEILEKVYRKVLPWVKHPRPKGWASKATREAV